jgi:hypothetical protein
MKDEHMVSSCQDEHKMKQSEMQFLQCFYYQDARSDAGLLADNQPSREMKDEL